MRVVMEDCVHAMEDCTNAIEDCTNAMEDCIVCYEKDGACYRCYQCSRCTCHRCIVNMHIVNTNSNKCPMCRAEFKCCAYVSLMKGHRNVDLQVQQMQNICPECVAYVAIKQFPMFMQTVRRCYPLTNAWSNLINSMDDGLTRDEITSILKTLSPFSMAMAADLAYYLHIYIPQLVVAIYEPVILRDEHIHENFQHIGAHLMDRAYSGKFYYECISPMLAMHLHAQGLMCLYRPFGLPTSAFGLDTRPFGLDTRPFGLPTSAFGLDTRPFGLDNDEHIPVFTYFDDKPSMFLALASNAQTTDVLACIRYAIRTRRNLVAKMLLEHFSIVVDIVEMCIHFQNQEILAFIASRSPQLFKIHPNIVSYAEAQYTSTAYSARIVAICREMTA
jgi:hypothetical protein